MVRSRCGISAVGGRGGCRRVPFGLPARRTQVLARRSSGTRFGREQVPCLLLDQRSHPTEPEVAAPALICGPATREVRRTRPVSDRPWPRGAKRTPCTPAQRPSLAPRRETYAAHAQLVVVGGPAAREVRRAGPVSGRPWPRGAKRTAVHAQLVVVGGPAAREVRRARATGGHRWPGGANRLSIPSEPRTSWARLRQPNRRPQVTPPQSPLRTS